MTSFKFNAFRREASFGLLFLILGLSGCGNGDRSTTTTWFYGNPKGLAFKSIDHNGTPPPGMVFVPGGSFVMGATQESVALDPDNVPKYASVSSFYMDEIEVPNVSYCEYLNWMA
ncbi:MAG: SUMF1/EgtB/PvdO family nonheme iron enzyme, partial [Bacteroidetes bacterium]|nr:SUMF1/EgtB/PvdO family nonheme iron enzyme [Bacteroidota bacterium]